MRADETIAIAALIQALVVKLHQLRQGNLNFMIYKRALLNENKWRASRYGIDGKLIDFGKEAEVNTRGLIHELLEFVSTAVDHLGTHQYMDYIRTMLEQGTGADRQLEVFTRTNDMKAVVDYYVEQTVADL
jgi:carboxylate-amine ligase